MSLKLIIDPGSSANCANAILKLPEIPCTPIFINLCNLTLGGKESSACMLAVEVNGEWIEHLVRQSRHVESCRLVLFQLQAAPGARFIEVVLKPLIDELQLALGLTIAVPTAAEDPIFMTKALANSAAAGLLSFQQLEQAFGQQAGYCEDMGE